MVTHCFLYLEYKSGMTVCTTGNKSFTFNWLIGISDVGFCLGWTLFLLLLLSLFLRLFSFFNSHIHIYILYREILNIILIKVMVRYHYLNLLLLSLDNLVIQITYDSLPYKGISLLIFLFYIFLSMILLQTPSKSIVYQKSIVYLHNRIHHLC